MGKLTKLMLAALALLFTVTTVGCAETSAGGGGVNVVKNPEEKSSAEKGIPPDKEAEIMLVLQQREVSTRKCYQDVLNEKQDRTFQGSVKVVIALRADGGAQDVRVVGSTLNNKEVEDCLVGTISRFEFPALAQAGEVQYEFRFRPAY